jgi:OOP family OmpA-OmpF porin
MKQKVLRNCFLLLSLLAFSFIVGCAGWERSPDGFFRRTELVEADRAIDKARQQGKDSECPEQFAQAENMRNNAYEMFKQCNTHEALRVAGEAKQMAAALCPTKPAPPKPMDRDGDGVPDNLDKCPNTPAGVPVDRSGCPKDSDGDGVPDYLDKCPGTLKGIPVDDKGCPLPMKEEVSIDLLVEFAFDRAIVKNIYHDHIMTVSNFLKTYPGTNAVIEGHTDSIGTEEYNLKLSQKRAENVIKHMVDNGIDPARLSAKGFGESEPIADNMIEAGRQKNRRVVAVIKAIKTK